MVQVPVQRFPRAGDGDWGGALLGRPGSGSGVGWGSVVAASVGDDGMGESGRGGELHCVRIGAALWRCGDGDGDGDGGAWRRTTEG